MSIRLELYRIFDTVARNHSFSKGAKELYMTQPAVSQAISQLESELNIRLFTRLPRGVVLTKEGQTLFEYTNSAIGLLEMGEKKLKETRDFKQGELRLGVSDTIARYYLIPYLERFHTSYPNIKLKIVNRTTEELCYLIKSGKIDISICNLPLKEEGLEILICKDIQDIFIFGEKYKELIDKKLDFKDLKNYPLIFLDTRSRSRLYVEKFLLSKGIKINPEVELGSHDLLLEFVKVGLGISAVVKEFCEDEILQGKVYELNLIEQIPKRAIGICYLKGVSLNPISEKFIEYLLKKQ